MKLTLKSLPSVLVFSALLYFLHRNPLAFASPEDLPKEDSRQDLLCEPALSAPTQRTSVAERDRIALTHVRLVIWKAHRLARKMGNLQLLPDLIGEGNLGLIEAGREAEESMLAKPEPAFLNFAASYINGYMMRFIRTLYTFPKSRTEISNGIQFRARAEDRMLFIIDDPSKKLSILDYPYGGLPTFKNLTMTNSSAALQLQAEHPRAFSANELLGSNTLHPDSKVEEFYIREEILEIIRTNFDEFMESLSPRQREIFRLKFSAPDDEKLSLEDIGKSLTTPISDFTVAKEMRAIETKLRDFFVPLLEGTALQEASTQTPAVPDAPSPRREISDATVVHAILSNSGVSEIVNNLIPEFLADLNDTVDRRVFEGRTSSPQSTFAQLNEELQRSLSQLAKIEARVFRAFVIFIAPYLSEHRTVVGEHFFHAADEFRRRMAVNERVNNAKTLVNYFESLLQRPEILEAVTPRLKDFDAKLKDAAQRRIFFNRLQPEPLSIAAIARELGVSRQTAAEREIRIVRNFLKFMEPFWPSGFVPEQVQ